MGQVMSQIWILLLIAFAVGAYFGWRYTRPRPQR